MMIWGWIAVIVGIALIINLASMGKYLDDAFLDGHARGYDKGYRHGYKDGLKDAEIEDDDGK